MLNILYEWRLIYRVESNHLLNGSSHKDGLLCISLVLNVLLLCVCVCMCVCLLGLMCNALFAAAHFPVIISPFSKRDQSNVRVLIE